MRRQARDFQRWGVLADWDAVSSATASSNPSESVSEGIYRTLDPAYEAAQIRLLRAMLAQGLVFRGLRPVHWSPSSRTAMAEAELEYADDHKSVSVTVSFPVSRIPPGSPLQELERPAFVAWTTTPWTLPANEALCIHPDMDYAALRVVEDVPPANGRTQAITAGTTFVVAESRVCAFAETLGVSLDGPHLQAVAGWPVKGHLLVGAQCQHPLASLDQGVYGEDAPSSALLAGDVSGPKKRLPPVLPGWHVTDDSGTGVVHTAPGHGQEDFQCILDTLNQRPHIHDATVSASQLEEITRGIMLLNRSADKDSWSVSSVRCPIDGDGRFTADAGPLLQGLDAMTEGGVRVLQALEENGMLLASAEWVHRYPIDWRTKKPVMTRATTQWFASADALHDHAVQALSPGKNGVDFFPARGRSRLEATVQGRKAWCISRQRSWGVPIPVFYDVRGATPQPLLDDRALAFAEQVMREQGSDAWWRLSPAELLPAHPPEWRELAQQGSLVRGSDTLDVWFDSGVAWLASWQGRANDQVPNDPESSISIQVSGEAPLMGFASDMVIEGSDQHRGWFQSSLLTATVAKQSAPFRQILTHGFVLDGLGRKMSKSIGNVVVPADLIQGDGLPPEALGQAPSKKQGKKNKQGGGSTGALGVDVLRQWVASADVTTDMSLSAQSLVAATDSVRRLRNVSRFLLGSLTPRSQSLFGEDPHAPTDSFDPSADHSEAVLHAWTSPEPLDTPAGALEQYLRFRLRRTAEAVHSAMGSERSLARASTELQSFLSNEVSALFVDASKDTLYAHADQHWRRRAAQACAWQLLRGITVMSSIVAPFAAEDVFQHSCPVLLAPHSLHVVGDRDLLAHPMAPLAGLLDVCGAVPSWESLIPSAWGEHDLGVAHRWGGVETLRSLVNQAAEQARRAGTLRQDLGALATVIVAEASPLAESVRWMESQEQGPAIASQLCDVFKVSQLNIITADSARAMEREQACLESDQHFLMSTSLPGQAIVVLSSAPGHACDRCWRVHPSVPAKAQDHQEEDLHTLCERCAEVVSERL
jgi:isoleucyl-tRNA synthetase